MKLSKSEIEVLTKVKEQGVMPVASGRGAIKKHEGFENARTRLLKSGHLTPASKNRVIISRTGIEALKEAQASE